MTLSHRVFGSTIGRKMLMAITGLMLTGFVLMHMSGNLLVFAGPDALNHYAAGLKSLGGLLWIARGGLLAAFVLHIFLGITLTAENRAARPEKYAYEATIQASLASRYMIHTGLMMLLFICYHLAHYTFRIASADVNAVPAENVYGMIIAGFSNPVVSGFYLLAMASLGLHLSHGVSSLFQSLGLHHQNINVVSEKLGPLVGALVFVGFSSIPVAVLTGILH